MNMKKKIKKLFETLFKSKEIKIIGLIVLGLLLFWIITGARSCSRAKYDSYYWKARVEQSEKVIKEKMKEMEASQKEVKRIKNIYEKKISELSGYLNSANKAIAEKDMALEKKAVEIQELEKTGNKDALIIALKEQFSLAQNRNIEKDKVIANLNAQIKEKDLYIQALEYQFGVCTKDFNKVVSENTNYRKNIKVLEKRVAWLQFTSTVGKVATIGSIVVGGYFLLKK